MKKYMKPDMLVTEFTPNEAISLCETTTSNEWNNQTIDCVINGNETIFYDGCDTKAADGMLKWVDANSEYDVTAGYYYCWSASTTGKPDDDEQAKIDYLMGLFGKSGPGWHVGPATPDVIKVHNMS